MQLKLYGAPLSPYVRKVRIVFAEKGLEYEHDGAIAPMNMPDWYESMHPLKRIPTLTVQEGEMRTIVPDSSAICAWADRHAPEPALYPSAPLDHARALWLEELSDTGLAEAVGMRMFRPVLFNILQKKEPDMETAKKGLKRVRRLLAYLESQLAESGFLVGDAPSIADIAVCAQLSNMEHIGYRIQPEDGEGMHALYERMMARKSLQGCFAHEKKILERMEFRAPNFA